jgi:hypothetical protein
VHSFAFLKVVLQASDLGLCCFFDALSQEIEGIGGFKVLLLCFVQIICGMRCLIL